MTGSFALLLHLSAGLPCLSVTGALLGSGKPETVSLLRPGVTTWLAILVCREGKQRGRPGAWAAPFSCILPPLEPPLSLFVCFPLSASYFPAGSRCRLPSQPSWQTSHDPRSHLIQGLQVLITFVSHHQKVIDKRIIWTCVSNLISPKHVLPFSYLGSRQ